MPRAVINEYCATRFTPVVGWKPLNVVNLGSTHCTVTVVAVTKAAVIQTAIGQLCASSLETRKGIPVTTRVTTAATKGDRSLFNKLFGLASNVLFVSTAGIEAISGAAVRAV